MTRRMRVALRILAALALLLAICVAAALLVVQSGWFRERVRERVVSEIERATGGRAEIGNFALDWTHLTATVSPLVLHGTEHAGEPPLLHVQSVSLGFRIVSMFERKVDLLSLTVDQPQLRIAYYPDGSNNLPVPRGTSGEVWAKGLVDLAIRRYEVRNGLVEFDNRRIPLDLRGENLRVEMDYELTASRYSGQLSSQHVHLTAQDVQPVELGVSAQFTLDRTRIQFPKLAISTKESHFDLTGAFEDLRQFSGAFAMKALVSVREAAAAFSLPIAPAGSAALDGKLAVILVNGFVYDFTGRVDARGLGYSRDRLKIAGAEIHGDLHATPDLATLRRITGTALGSHITGQAELRRRKDFHFEGNFQGMEVREAANVITNRPIAWNGRLSGDFSVDARLGERVAQAKANVSITPAPEGTPLEGQLALAYDQRAGTLALGDSYLATPSTRLDFHGTLGQSLEIGLRCTNVDDLLPALAILSDDAPQRLPLKVISGAATLQGAVGGRLENLRFRGQTNITGATLYDRAFDRFATQITGDRQHLSFDAMSIVRGANRIEGSGKIDAAEGTFLDQSFLDGTMSASLALRNLRLPELAKEAGISTVAGGDASGTVRLSGTPRHPEAELEIAIDKPAAWGEQLDRLSAKVNYAPAKVTITSGEADAGSGKLRFEGAYQHREDDWKNGDVRFDLSAQGVPADHVAALEKLEPGISGALDGKASGDGRVVNGGFVLGSLNGSLSARAVTIEGESLGDVNATAEMTGNQLAIQATTQVQEASIRAQGEWRLEGDDPGSVTIRFSRTSVATLHRLVMIGGTAEQKASTPPFEGFLEGSATLTIALAKPKDFQGEARIDTLQLNAKPTQNLRLGVQAQDVVLKNTAPIVAEISAKEARIRSAQLSARETNLVATGTIPFDSATGADLSVRGSVNLTILQLLNPDLLARGNADVSASIRGSLRDPQLNGRMELKNASLYLNDLPNGVDNANGVIFFDRNRATVERLTAETGGGTVTIGGFLEFGSSLTYRLQAQAQQVRVRYPEDVSITASAQLSLNGTSDSSTVSGFLTLNRASIAARADLGELLAQTAKPVPTPVTPNDYLRGMRFDVRVQSAPAFELETSLTRNVQSEVDLRLRGTPLRPVLLGTISVNSGEIQVFGNRYTVNRGDIRFLNPVRIEPTLDVNLETKARGITVNISLSGTPEKLNVNYSSDPPLQSREIIALLAVGRNPSSSGGLADSQVSSSSASFLEAGSGLLGQAVSEQLSSRLQRFFGASRVKIDPTLTGVDNFPEARLTLEQQVSKDITLTYITNLNRTQEQIVQIQWDLNRQWSAVAVRDSNGLFGIDFQYKKRF